MLLLPLGEEEDCFFCVRIAEGFEQSSTTKGSHPSHRNASDLSTLRRFHHAAE